jgi:thiol-disulfide isomerase/thioredoxin
MIRRRQWMVGTAGAAAAAGIAGGVWHRQQNAVADSPLWPLQFSGPRGEPIAMAALKGKPLIVNFWATWCAPCVKELPEFDRFHQTFGPQGWQVIGLAIDNAAAVNRFLARTPVKFPIAIAGPGGSTLMHDLGNAQGVLPFTVVIDRRGQVVQRRMGETAYTDLEAWAKAS